MSLFSYVESIFDKQKNGEFKTIYIMVDIHNTILKPSFNKDVENFEYFPFAKETLSLITSLPNVKLIMWTSSYDDKTEMYLKHFKDNGIVFDYVNSNPEYKDLPFASFKTKFYYDIGIDDKFGFDANIDWYNMFKLISDYK